MEQTQGSPSGNAWTTKGEDIHPFVEKKGKGIYWPFPARGYEELRREVKNGLVPGGGAKVEQETSPEG